MNENFWKNRNVLVTGAGGFKGSHLVGRLAESKANVISLIRDLDPRSYFETQGLGKKSIEVIGDLKDFRKMSDIMSKYSVNNIFHFGAQPIVTTALSNPKETLESNIMGTVNILEASRLFSKAEGIVFVSSDKAYGPSKNLPYNEKERLEGKAPYDVSKSCADLIAQMYSKVYGMPITITRCANVFGPGDLNMSRIVPSTIEAILQNKTLKIRSDGKMIRDYIYVDDAIDAYILLAENMDKTRGNVFNITGKKRLSVLEMVNEISGAAGIKVELEILNQAKAEIPEQYLDGSKIKNAFGWEARRDFKSSIMETLKWYEGFLRN